MLHIFFPAATFLKACHKQIYSISEYECETEGE